MKFFIKKLGCPKNDVDGDYIAGFLIRAGHQIVTDDISADAVIVNTCGFILPAKEESVEEILYYEKMKNERKIQKLYVTGCLAQRYKDDLQKEIPGIDNIFGLGGHEQMVEAVSNIVPIRNFDDNLQNKFPNPKLRHIDTVVPYEYLKISDGCNRFCSYCAIPLIRGRYQSRPMKDIIEETQILADTGKKEIILVSQEGTGYGHDLGGDNSIIKLLSEVEKVAGIEWIKLMYLHPEAVTDDLIDFMTFSPKIQGYFDIPLQHINDDILSRMNRPIARIEIEKLLNKIRGKSSNNLIRTTFIAGFPGETMAQFEELHDFISDFEFDRLGVFKYSNEEGTPAAEYDYQISEEEKERRQDELMLLQQEIAFKKNIDLIATIQEVIVDKAGSDSTAEGRTRGDCPEIDQTIFIKGDNIRVGDFLKVRIIMVEGYDLIATPFEAER
jgi:ribosomal protein S12 methylthiotransferase